MNKIKAYLNNAQRYVKKTWVGWMFIIFCSITFVSISAAALVSLALMKVAWMCLFGTFCN